jgi:hypothetical protein
MEHADFVSAMNLAATCSAGQEAVQRDHSPFWYGQAKILLPGLSGTSPSSAAQTPLFFVFGFFCLYYFIFWSEP